jgi:type II secretory pathway pseudopilin PulG
MKSRFHRERRGTACAGFSLLEVMMAGGILIFGALALSQATVQSMKLAQQNRETAVAQAAIRQAIEDLQARPFDQIFVLFNGIASDDPAGGGPGASFDVPGLTPRADDADGMVGRVFLPEVTDLVTSTLREDLQDASLGMPRDLNGDGDVDEGNHAGDYQILPVRVRLEWTGKGGDRMLEVRSVVSDR